MSWEAAASVAGPIISGIFGQGATGSANRTNLKIAQKQEDFQREMSGSAHQREVADLRAAGLNPLLSAGGNGSSTPVGASTRVEANNELGKGLERSVSNAMDARRLRNELDATGSQVSLNKAAANTQATQAQLNVSNAVSAKASAEQTALKNAALKSQMPAIARRADVDLKHAEIDARWANEDAILKRTGTATGAIGNLFGAGRFIKSMFNSPKSRPSPTGYSEEQYDRQGEHTGTRSRRYNFD